MKKLGTIEVEPHPIPDRWVIGTLHEYGRVDVCAVKLGFPNRTSRYCITLADNVMNSETGEFQRAEVGETPCIYPTLYAAFEAFQKFYQ